MRGLNLYSEHNAINLQTKHYSIDGTGATAKLAAAKRGTVIAQLPNVAADIAQR